MAAHWCQGTSRDGHHQRGVCTWLGISKGQCCSLNFWLVLLRNLRIERGPEAAQPPKTKDSHRQ